MSTRRYDPSQRASPLGLGNRDLRGEGTCRIHAADLSEPANQPSRASRFCRSWWQPRTRPLICRN